MQRLTLTRKVFHPMEEPLTLVLANSDVVANYSESKRLIREGDVLVNGAVEKSTVALVKEGDKVTVTHGTVCVNFLVELTAI